jgi:hypothetical protein
MTNFYAKNDSHCQLSLDGQTFYTNLCFAGIQYGHALCEAADLFQGMNTTAHNEAPPPVPRRGCPMLTYRYGLYP